MNPPFVVDANKIKELRENAGLTQAALAKRAKVSQASVSKAEKHGRSSRQVAQKLAGYFGVPLGELRPSNVGPSPMTRTNPERKMHLSDMSPDVREVMEGAQEILESGVEAVVAALIASIRAFRLSARALHGTEERKRAKRIAAEGKPD